MAWAVVRTVTAIFATPWAMLPSIQCICYSVPPVSYTHLDVYKRQVLQESVATLTGHLPYGEDVHDRRDEPEGKPSGFYNL